MTCWRTWKDNPNVGAPGALVFVHPKLLGTGLYLTPTTTIADASFQRGDVSLVVANESIDDEMNTRYALVLTSSGTLGWVRIYDIAEHEP